MKRILFATTAIMICTSLFGQSKKMQLSLVTAFRHHQMGMNAQSEPVIKDGVKIYPQQVIDYSKEVQNNEEFDQTALSNKLDKFLREEFFTGFPVDLAPKSELLENEKYQKFESAYYSGKPSKSAGNGSGLAGKLNKLSALDGGTAAEESETSNTKVYKEGGDLADGYKSFAWGIMGNIEDEEIRSYFPETDIFVNAIFSGNLNSTDYGKESGFSCNVQLLFYKRGKKRNNKVFQFLGYKNIDDYSFEKYVSEPDIDAIYKVREQCLDSAIEKMKDKKEKRIEQFQKWLEK